MRIRNSFRVSAALAFAALAMLPATSQAQSQTALTHVEPAPVALRSQPTVSSDARSLSTAAPAVAPLGAQPRGVALGLHRVAADSMTPPPAPADNDRGNTGLMLAGAAAMIVGAVVGDDAGTLIIVGGAVIGFYGLYRFLTN